MMNHVARTLAVAAFAVAVTAGCSKSSSSGDDKVANHQATVEKIAGSEGARVTLTDKAIERIGLETAAVADGTGALASKRTMPNAAVLYDPTGKTWTYVTERPGAYLRTPIVVERVVGDQAILSDGPATGASVVTTGAQELYGAESTFGED